MVRSESVRIQCSESNEIGVHPSAYSERTETRGFPPMVGCEDYSRAGITELTIIVITTTIIIIFIIESLLRIRNGVSPEWQSTV